MLAHGLSCSEGTWDLLEHMGSSRVPAGRQMLLHELQEGHRRICFIKFQSLSVFKGTIPLSWHERRIASDASISKFQQVLQKSGLITVLS